MKVRNWFLCTLLLALVCSLAGGCARAARDTSGFALTDAGPVAASFETTWQTTKAVLRNMDVDIYTRDKRGVFVAYSKMKRQLLVPRRQQYTILLDARGEKETFVTIETLDQVYGVTLLTYPSWHDRKTSDNSTAQAILKAIQEQVAAPAAEPAPVS